MAYPIVGTKDPVLQQQVWRWNPQNGSSYDEVWKGLDLASMTTKYNGLVYTTKEAELTFGQAMAELKVKWGGNDGGSGGNTLAVTSDRWECPEPEVSKPVFDHPDFVAGMDALLAYMGLPVDDTNRAEQIAAWNRGATAGTKFASLAPNWKTFVTSSPVYGPLMARDYQKVANGQTSYYDSQYSVRHVTRAPNYWSRNVSDDNINAILSPSFFFGEVTDASLWNFVMPGRLQYKISAAVSALISRLPTRASYEIGWLKKASAETQIQGGYIEISTVYILDQWSTDLYPYAS